MKFGAVPNIYIHIRYVYVRVCTWARREMQTVILRVLDGSS